MKKFLCIAIISLLAISVFGQSQRRPFERVHAAKLAYITDRIQLTRTRAEGSLSCRRGLPQEPC